MRAVINVPERRAASTITTPMDRPEMMRFRRGKSWARGTKPGGFCTYYIPGIARNEPYTVARFAEAFAKVSIDCGIWFIGSDVIDADDAPEKVI